MSVAGREAVKVWLILATDSAVTVISWAALFVTVVGTVEAFFQGLRTMFVAGDGHVNPDVWLRLGRWLVAGFTFQLAADIYALQFLRPGGCGHYPVARHRCE
jgi:hypothetical protein